MADKITCSVCGGIGGWENDAVSGLPSDKWTECAYCDSYGFVEAENGEDNKGLLLAYNGYKKIITDILGNFGNVIAYTTEDFSKHIQIDYVPSSRIIFSDFAKKAMKFNYYNKRLDIELSNIFTYSHPDKYFYYSRIVLKPMDISDLDGFIDFLRAWRIGVEREARMIGKYY